MQNVGLVDENPAALVSLSSLVILEPIKNILALNLTIKAQLSRYLLDLISTRSSQPRPEQFRQNFYLLACRVPPPALCPRAAASTATAPRPNAVLIHHTLTFRYIDSSTTFIQLVFIE